MRTGAERANRLVEQGNPFAPPRTRRGRLRAWCMAIAAHSLLAAALLWTVRTPVPVDLPMVQAEFWAQEELPPPKPAPQPEPVPAPPPTLAPPTQPTLQDLREAEIALERQRQQMQRLEQLERERQQWLQEQERLAQERLEQERLAQAERERQEAERQAAEEQALAERKAAQERAQQAAREQAEAEKKAAQEAQALAEAKREAEREAAEKRAAEARRRQQEQAAAERRRQDNIRRMQEMAGSRSNAPPSAEYTARVKALILSNTTYPTTSANNPRVRVRIHVAPDGRIVKVAITQASGTPAWDSAVLRALQKTAALPPDRDGRMPYGGAYIDIDFRPYD